MQRSGTQEREYQLQAWDASLVERQQSLEAVMTRFQARVSQEAKGAQAVRQALTEQAAQLHNRELKVAAREKAVAEAEASLLKLAKSIEAQQASLEHATQAIDATDDIHTLLEAIESVGASDVQHAHHDADEQELNVLGPASTTSPARAVARATSSGRSPPSANKVPTIAMMSLATRSPGKSDDDGGATPRQQRTHHIQEDASATPPSRSPQLYEGRVDPRLPSMVEEIQEDEPTPPKPRGLRSSPQFHPMDPNDSGLGFLRPSPQHNGDGAHDFDEEEEEEEEDEEDVHNHEWDEELDDEGREALQDQLDTAIHFLVSEGIVNEQELEAWLQSGASAQQIIALYHEQQQRMRPDDGDTPRRYGRDDHEDEFEYHDGDEDLMYDDDDGAGEDGGDHHRSESSSAGEPITVDSKHEVLEDRSPNRTSGDGGEHNDSLASNRVRGGSASPRSVQSAGGAGEGSPNAGSTSRRHTFDSFDEDSDDNEF